MLIKFNANKCFKCRTTITPKNQYVGKTMTGPGSNILLSKSGGIRKESYFYKFIAVKDEDILSGKTKIFMCKECWVRTDLFSYLSELTLEEYRARGFKTR